ncbi:glycosyltransferase family 61 protein [Jatrophihabitans fulvus]
MGTHLLRRRASDAWVRGRGLAMLASSAATRPEGPLAAIAPLVPRRHRRTVVVLADGHTPPALLSRFASWRHDDAVTVLSDGGAPSGRGRRLLVAPSAADEIDTLLPLGPLDVVVDVRGVADETRERRWHRLFLLLRPEGSWVVSRLGTGDLRRTERDWLARLLRAAAGETFDAPIEEAERWRSVGALVAGPELLVVRKQLQHRVKLRPGEASTVLRARDPQVSARTLARLPAQRVESRTVVHSHGGTPAGLATALDVPPMTLTHYRGPVAYGGQALMVTPHSVLNESFRFWNAPDPVHPLVLNAGGRFVRVRPEAEPVATLDGDFFVVDPQYRAHFGHIMTELVTRLWGWDEAKARLPGLKALLVVDRGQARLERQFLRAYGIADDDVAVVRGPVRLRSVVAATPMWHNWTPQCAHPDVVRVWDRLAAALVDPSAPVHERVFVTRPDSISRRRCRNARAVEELFAAHGFAVVRPETLSLGQQAGIFGRARVVAGFGGSAMFNLMYAANVRTVIVLNHEAYTARNEQLYALLRADEVHYFWSRPDIAQPADGWRLDAFQSEWEFDFARHRADLEDVLRAL